MNNQHRIGSGKAARSAGASAGGFTLVEVALAVVVVAIGIMAAFSLISVGLDSSAKAVAETRAALFADDVFNGLRAKSNLALDETASTWGTWEEFWDKFVAGDVLLPVAAGPMWQFDVYKPPPVWPPVWPPPGLITNYLKIAAGGPHLVTFTNYSYRASAITDIRNAALRYSLDITVNTEELPGSPGVTWTNKVKALLNIWEGEFGPTETKDALTFASEFMNAGGL